MSSAYRKEHPRFSENKSWMNQSQSRFGSCTMAMARTRYLYSTIIVTRIAITATHGASNIDRRIFSLVLSVQKVPAIRDDSWYRMNPRKQLGNKTMVDQLFLLLAPRISGSIWSWRCSSRRFSSPGGEKARNRLEVRRSQKWLCSIPNAWSFCRDSSPLNRYFYKYQV